MGLNCSNAVVTASLAMESEVSAVALMQILKSQPPGVFNNRQSLQRALLRIYAVFSHDVQASTVREHGERQQYPCGNSRRSLPSCIYFIKKPQRRLCNFVPGRATP